jgi:hypothetical protein
VLAARTDKRDIDQHLVELRAARNGLPPRRVNSSREHLAPHDVASKWQQAGSLTSIMTGKAIWWSWRSSIMVSSLIAL